MAGYNPGNGMLAADGVATSAFRVAIPNPERYTKQNTISLEHVAKACDVGDYEWLEKMLATGKAHELFNGDLNGFFNRWTCLHYAAKTGNTECVELLLRAKADPHMRENMPYGKDPEDGKTALDLATNFGWQDTAEVLAKAEKEVPYGSYAPAGKDANAKVYNGFEWGQKPELGWYFRRPGAAKAQGLDPAKFGIVEGSGGSSSSPIAPQAKAMAQNTASLPSSTPAPKPKPKPLPFALLFPGQGSQYVGMLKDCQAMPAVQEMLRKAQEALGYDILPICLQGPESELLAARTSQVALLVAGLAALEKLRYARPDVVDRRMAVAGMSLGEYVALCAAGVLSFDDCLELVVARASFMEEAARAAPQKMMSVAGLEKDQLDQFCQEVAVLSGEVCQISNELFPLGFSVGGGPKAIEELMERVKAANAMQAKVVVTLGAFHTPLMSPASEKFHAKLLEMQPRMNSPTCDIYMNACGGRVEAGADPSVVVNMLLRQLTSPVLWRSCVEGMIAAGVEEFFEIGPMKQLKAIMKRIDPVAWQSVTNIMA